MLELLNKFITWWNLVSNKKISFTGQIVLISPDKNDFSDFTFKSYDPSIIISEDDIYLMKMKPVSAPYTFDGYGTIPDNGYFGRINGVKLKFESASHILQRTSNFYPITAEGYGGFTGISRSTRTVYKRLIPVAVIVYDTTQYFFNFEFLYNFRENTFSSADSSNTQGFNEYFSLFNANIRRIKVTYGSCCTWDPPGNNFVIYTDIPGKCSLISSASQYCYRNDFIDSYYSYCSAKFNVVDASDVEKLTKVLSGTLDEFDSLVNKPVEFYLSSPGLPLNTKRGESIQLEFSLKYSDGSLVNNVPFTYENSQPDATGITNWIIEGNTLTFTNECWYAIAWIRFHSADYPELEYELEVHIKDPMPQPNLPGPYLPEGGGISGGGNGSTGSNTVTGTFDAQPGPSIVENLPVGSSGADIASSGMYTKYLCNNALLNLLAEFFWEDNVGIQALKAVLGNPIDSIISLTAYPFALETLVPTTATTIYFGQYDSHFSAFSLTKSSFQIDWGSVTIPFFWGSFLDYSPYTKIQLYLPWGVGFVSIDPNEVVPWSSKNSYNKADFVNGTIRVVTNIELDKGACVHNIIGNNGRVIGSFGGVVGKQVPVTGSDNSARILAMMSAAISSSSAVGMAAGGAVASGKNLAYGKGMTMAERAEGREMIGNYKSSVGGAIQSLSGGIASPPSYPRAGTFSDATNTLSYQYPYLIISRPSQSVPQQYGRFMGYPSNIFHAHLGEVRGYTEVSSIHLDKITATANELDELESILKGGVLL